MAAALTPDQVRAFIQDDPGSNFLLEKEEFSTTRIQLIIDMTVNSFNAMTPVTYYTLDNFPNPLVLLYGVLQNLYLGQSALSARNTMGYSDGGISLPIEERFEMYNRLASQYGSLYADLGRQMKIQANLESGWGSVGSDYGNMPVW